jgi:hypothetical protein
LSNLEQQLINYRRHRSHRHGRGGCH